MNKAEFKKRVAQIVSRHYLNPCARPYRPEE